ncbi:MAG: hypothetical protein K0R34_853 [Herbinix sp.]|jgi:hypothetical protein|nr:hypothetical protein [Herbinix sp.]
MTLKKALLRGIAGAPIGVFIGYTITILIALANKGEYNPVVPKLAVQMNSELMAVVLQYVLMAIMGYVFSASSAVYEVEQWGIAKRTMIHYLIITITTFPIAYVCYWMNHSLFGILSYVGIFTGYYLIGWIAQMYFWKRKIRRINEKLRDSK